jgi:chromate transporter
MNGFQGTSGDSKGKKPIVSDAPNRQPLPTLSELFLQFLYIGAISFGGGIVAYEKSLIVEKRGWLDEDQFMANLAISQTMPGLNSVNLAVLAGDYLRGTPGAVAATLGLIIPGTIFVLIIGAAYNAGQEHPIVSLLLAGVATGATGLLSAITWKLGGKMFRQLKSFLIIIATFCLMTVFKLSLIKVLLVMAPIALFMYRPGR